MKQVKGTVFLTVAKSIRSNKSGVYDTLLKEKDKEIINSRILPSIWYPFENYKNCLNALIKIEAKNNLENCIEWGRFDVVSTMKGVYSNAIVKGDIKATMEKFNRIFKLMFNFSELIVEFPSENELNLILKDFDHDFKGFYYIGRGWIEKVIEFCIDKKAKSRFLTKSWESNEDTILNFFWSP